MALVAGAASGMGLARAFAPTGALVVLTDRHEASLGAATGAPPSSGDAAVGVACDVSDEAAAAVVVARAVAIRSVEVSTSWPTRNTGWRCSPSRVIDPWLAVTAEPSLCKRDLVDTNNRDF